MKAHKKVSIFIPVAILASFVNDYVPSIYVFLGVLSVLALWELWESFGPIK